MADESRRPNPTLSLVHSWLRALPICVVEARNFCDVELDDAKAGVKFSHFHRSARAPKLRALGGAAVDFFASLVDRVVRRFDCYMYVVLQKTYVMLYYHSCLIFQHYMINS